MIIKGYILAGLYGILCLLIAFVAAKLGLHKKYTRKIVHVLVGFEWFILNRYFGTSYHFLIVCLAFTALLAITYKGSLLPMISSDEDNAPGTVYYGVSMSLMALVTLLRPEFSMPFGIAVVCTSLSDGFAGVFGGMVRRFNPKIYGKKTLVGYFACFIITFVAVLVFSAGFDLGIDPGKAILIAVFVSGAELISSRGLDNIAIPLGSFSLSYFVLNYDVSEYIVPILLTPYIIAVVLSKKILSPRATVAAVILDFIVSMAFGNFGFVLLLAFLMLTAVIDKIKAHIKGQNDEITEKGDRRDEMQVIANGIVSLVCAMLYMSTHSEVWLVAYTVSLAECFADSCASGVGVLSKNAYDIVRWRKIPVGLSGGVSLLGTVASLFGAALISLIPLAFGVIDLPCYAFVIVCAFFGALVDSILGSTVQVKYRCGVCGIITEKREHCSEVAERVGGIAFINNDAVNIISCAISVILCFALMHI